MITSRLPELRDMLEMTRCTTAASGRFITLCFGSNENSSGTATSSAPSSCIVIATGVPVNHSLSQRCSPTSGESTGEVADGGASSGGTALAGSSGGTGIAPGGGAMPGSGTGIVVAPDGVATPSGAGAGAVSASGGRTYTGAGSGRSSGTRLAQPANASATSVSGTPLLPAFRSSVARSDERGASHQRGCRELGSRRERCAIGGGVIMGGKSMGHGRSRCGVARPPGDLRRPAD